MQKCWCQSARKRKRRRRKRRGSLRKKLATGSHVTAADWLLFSGTNWMCGQKDGQATSRGKLQAGVESTCCPCLKTSPPPNPPPPPLIQRLCEKKKSHCTITNNSVHRDKWVKKKKPLTLPKIYNWWFGSRGTQDTEWHDYRRLSESRPAQSRDIILGDTGVW